MNETWDDIETINPCFGEDGWGWGLHVHVTSPPPFLSFLPLWEIVDHNRSSSSKVNNLHNALDKKPYYKKKNNILD